MSDAKIRTMQQVCARLDDATVEELDRYVREREREARVPLSRSLGLREVLDAWARDRRDKAQSIVEESARRQAGVDAVDGVDTARTRQHT